MPFGDSHSWLAEISPCWVSCLCFLQIYKILWLNCDLNCYTFIIITISHVMVENFIHINVTESSVKFCGFHTHASMPLCIVEFIGFLLFIFDFCRSIDFVPRIKQIVCTDTACLTLVSCMSCNGVIYCYYCHWCSFTCSHFLL